MRPLIVPIVWTLLVAALHALPGDSLGGSDWLLATYGDKLFHFFMFVGLSVTVLVAANKSDVWEGKRWRFLVIVAAYGVLLEGAQAMWFVTRSSELADVMADVAGTVVAWPLFMTVYRRWP